ALPPVSRARAGRMIATDSSPRSRLKVSAFGAATTKRILSDDPPSLATVPSVPGLARRARVSIAALKGALVFDPNFIGSYEALAACYLRQKRYAEAIAVLNEGRSHDSSSPRTLGVLAYADAVSGKRDDALRILEELKSAAETDDDALV